MNDTERTIADVYRNEWLNVLSSTVRLTRDLDAAEEATQEAFERAVRAWRRDGIPPNAGGWLTVAARRIAIDLSRKRWREQPLYDPEMVPADAANTSATGDVSTNNLRLIFLCCHPTLSPPSRVALALRLVCGVPVEAIAAHLLSSRQAIAARITRAKRTIRESKLPFDTPDGEDMNRRLPAVLATVYLVYTEGHTPSIGVSERDSSLADYALYLTRLLQELLPNEPEVLGLRSLLLLSEARRDARFDESGGLVPLARQERSRWNRELIDEGVALLPYALRGRGPYSIQAAIAAVHSEADSIDETDWAQIVRLYDSLLAITPTPVASLARAVALAELHGPEAGLREIRQLANDPAMEGSHRLFAARAELLRRRGEIDAARETYGQAAAMTRNRTEQAFLLQRRP